MNTLFAATRRNTPQHAATRKILIFKTSTKMILSFMLSLLGFGIGFAQKQKPSLRMQDFIGINLREGDPIQYANCAGFAREYHEWPDDEGNHLSLQNIPMAAVSQPYPNNRYAWNTSAWQSNRQYDNWYTSLTNRLNTNSGNFQPPVLPICATLKSCLPYVANKPQWFFGAESELILIEGSRTNSTNRLTPASYRWYADWVYQFTKKFGNSNVNLGTFKAALNEPSASINIGTNKVGYVELWNEPNKYWFDNDIAYHFSGEEYAALTCAAYYGRDGLGGNLTATAGTTQPVPTTSSYALGIRNADPNMRVVIGGTAGIRDLDSDFITNVKSWFTNHTDPIINIFPFDVINLHHYNSTKWDGIQLGQIETTAQSPESDHWVINGVDKKFKQRLKDIKTLVDASFTGRELWLSEFGFDTNENSPYRTPNITTNGFTSDRQEVQGQWLLRGYMEIAAAGWDRAMQFCIRDENPNDAPADGQGVFKASGMVRAKELGHAPKKSYYYVHSMKEILRNTKFDVELSTNPNATDELNPRVMRFKADKTTLSPNVFGDYVYSVWLPTSDNKKALNQKIYLGSTLGAVTANATLVTLQVGDLNGARTSLMVSSDNSGYYVTIPEVSERPVFFILGGSQPDVTISTPVVSAVGVSCNAIKATWTWTGARPNVSKYTVYYYEKNDSEENPTQSKALNISDKNLVVFTDNLQGTFNGSAVNEVLITGLKKTLDQYYIFIRAIDNNGVVTPINTAITQQGWTTATTLACSNNIITGITGITESTGTSVRAANQLFNYADVKPCYPQDISEIAGEWVRAGEPANTTLTAFLNLNDNYIIEGIAVLDGTAEGDLVIQAAQSGNTYLSILNYRTEYLNEWKYFPVSNITTAQLRIELKSDFARLKKVILYGRKVNTALLSSCPNCDATTAPTGLTVIGTNGGSVTNLSTLINNGTLTNTTTNRNIRVNGTFNIDADFTFENYNFSMKPASAIKILTDKQLNLVSTSIDGCDQMWKGITIQSGGRIDMNKAILRDAEIGLKFERSYNYYEWLVDYRTFGLTDSRIERNSVGLFIDRNYSSSFAMFNYDITTNSLISGVAFDGTESDLKPCYSGQNNGNCTNKATIGLSISDAYVNTYSQNPTKINNIRNVAQGIFAVNASLFVATTIFSNIQPIQIPNPYYDPMYYPFPSFTYGGQGVELYTGFFNQRGLGSNLTLSSNQRPTQAPVQSAPFTFQNVYQPFYFYNSWFNVYGNKIQGGQQEALYNNVNAPNNYSCFFENNYVSTKADGVKAYGVAYQGASDQNYYGVQIIDNFFENQGNKEQNSFVGTGVLASSYAQPANVGVDISRNYIQTQNGNGSIGIALSGTLNSNVQNNYVNLQSFSSAAVNTGFSLINNKSAIIANNTVEGRGMKQLTPTQLGGWPNNIGIYIQSSPTNTIRCNTLKNTKFPFQFVGENESTNGIKGNVMDGYFQGLALLDNTSVAPNPIIGVQTHMGNKWIPIDKGVGRTDAQHSSTDPAILELSRFNINQSLNGQFNPSVIIPSSGWFFQTNPTQGTYDCATNSGGGSLTNGGNGVVSRSAGDFEEIYARFANTDARRTSTESTNATEWVLRRNTLKAIKKLGNDRYGTEEDKRNRDNFAQKHATTSVNDFNDMEEQMAGLYAKKTADDSRLAEVGNSIVTTFKRDPNARLTEALGRSLQEYYKLLDKQNKKIKADAEQLKAANGRIRTSKPYEIYEKQVNEVYLSTIGQAKIMFTVQQERLLREIAVKCPAEVGLASYKARILWGMGSREKLPDSQCDNTQRILRGMPESTQVIAFSVHPNPAQNELTVNFAADDLEGVSWEITNLAGTKMSGGILKNNVQKMDTQHLTNGVYYMTIRKMDKSISVQKFVILH